ncbi:MAG: CotH kinase family protein [Pseudomonadota bacterium]|nr:CotH kinase family protein [Pseudomonadota bacterium]
MFSLLLACYLPVEEGAPSFVPSLSDGDDPYVDDTEDTAVDPPADDTAGETPLPEEEAPPNLVLNEVMSKNGFTLNVSGDYPDWVELYNDSAESVALDRVTLTDDSGRVWMGVEGEILPGGFLLVYADEGTATDHAPFTLDADGDTLTLAVDGWVVDRMATGELDADVSWARFPDGGDWAPTIWTTAGETNGNTPSDTLDTDSTMFGLYGVHTVYLDLDTAALASLRSTYSTYVEGIITVDGSEIDPIGARIRGSSTLRTIDQKCSFKIDTNRFGDLRFRGLKKFHLINMIWDASHVREYMSYHIMREFGVPSIRNSYAWLDVSGTDKGLYLFSEAYDDTFLESWYGNSDGYLWEPGSGDFTSAGSGWDCEEGYPCDTSVLEPIASLLRSTATDANVEAMEQVLDLESALRMIAGEIAVGQWDGYCSPHNYRVYWDPETGLASMQPSSLDLTFDNLGYNYGHEYFSCGGSILSWCLSNETCEERYLDILDELADRIEGEDAATSMQVMETLDEIEVLIDDYAADDAATGLSGYTYAQHTDQFAYIRAYLAAEPAEIRAQVDTRR